MKHVIAFACAAIVATAGLTIVAGQRGLGGQGGRGARVTPTTATSFDVMEKTIEELQAAMAAGRVTSRQLVEAYLARIDAYDRRGPEIGAFITINPHAVETAESLDGERASRGPRGPLHGIPIVLKDNFDTSDMPTTAGSIALVSHIPAPCARSAHLHASSAARPGPDRRDLHRRRDIHSREVLV